MDDGDPICDVPVSEPLTDACLCESPLSTQTHSWGVVVGGAGGVPPGVLQHRVLDDGSASGRRALLPLPVSGGPDVSGGAESGSADRCRLHLPAGLPPPPHTHSSCLLSDSLRWVCSCRWPRLWVRSQPSRFCCSLGSSSASTPSPGTCSGSPTSPMSGGGAV